MSEHLEQKIEELEKILLVQQAKPSLDDTVDKSSKYIRWLQSIIALIVVVVGMGITWGLTQGKISQLEQQIDAVQESHIAQCAKSELERITLRNDLMSVQIKQAAVDQLLNEIRADVAEIKTDVKAVMNRRK